MKYLLFFAVIIAGAYSCKKDFPESDGNCTGNCLTFKGKLIEKQTGNGLENVPIQLYYKKSPSLWGNSGLDYLGTTTTLTDGSYYFSFPRSSEYVNGGGKIVIMGIKEGYIDGPGDYLAMFDLWNSMDSVFDRNLSLWKSAPLAIRVRTVNNTNFDQFYFNQFFDNVSFIEFTPIEKNRQSFDVTYQLQTASDIPTRINWKTSNVYGGSGSIVLQGSDTIIVASGTSGNLLIEL